MRLLTTRPANPDLLHKTSPARVYRSDEVQQDRIFRACKLINKALLRTAAEKPRIVELCCGTGDICGHFSLAYDVVGADINQSAILKAGQRFPRLNLLLSPVEDLAPLPAEVLILCECLEHLKNPVKLVKAWLPHAERVVISHPIDEALDSDISGGEHCWSFSFEDFNGWFDIGGHSIEETKVFTMGKYNIAIGLGVNKNAHS